MRAEPAATPGALAVLPGASTLTCGAHHPAGCRARPAPRGYLWAARRPSAGERARARSGRGCASRTRTPASPTRPPRATSPRNADAPGARGRPAAENSGALVPGGRAARLPRLKPPTLALNCLQTPSQLDGT